MTRITQMSTKTEDDVILNEVKKLHLGIKGEGYLFMGFLDCARNDTLEIKVDTNHINVHKDRR